MSGHVYILASRPHGTIYIGCTTDLPKRVWEHRAGLVRGFTRKYEVKRLVYVETYDDVSDAIVRERRMKEWQRAWKVRLIERDNPDWQDIAVTLLGFEPLSTESPRQRPGLRNTSAREQRERFRLNSTNRVHGSRPSPG